MNDLELKRKRIETFVKVAATLGVGFIVAPFIFTAIQGLIGLVIAGGISFGLINFAPWIAAKFANWRIKAIKHEAAKNPVETLQNDYIKQQGALSRFEDSIRKFIGEVKTFETKLGGFKKQYPEEADKFEEQLSKMYQLLKLRQNKYKEAKKNLADYQMEIQKASAIWDMGQAAAALHKASGMTEEDFLAKIQVETALDSVQKNLNTAFADLEFSLMEENTINNKIEKDIKPHDLVETEFVSENVQYKKA